LAGIGGGVIGEVDEPTGLGNVVVKVMFYGLIIGLVPWLLGVAVGGSLRSVVLALLHRQPV
jgi:hypothetical protein